MRYENDKHRWRIINTKVFCSELDRSDAYVSCLWVKGDNQPVLFKLKGGNHVNKLFGR